MPHTEHNTIPAVPFTYFHHNSKFEEEDRKSFDILLNFSQTFGSKIHLLNVNTMNRFKSTKRAKQKMKAFLEQYETPSHSINIYNDDSIENGIVNFSKEINAWEAKVNLILYSLRL